jgi:hypothetical protein
VELTQVTAALPAVKPDLAKHLGLVDLLAEAAVTVLYIAGGENDPVSYFQEFRFIAALGAGYPQIVLDIYHDDPVVPVIMYNLN